MKAGILVVVALAAVAASVFSAGVQSRRDSGPDGGPAGAGSGPVLVVLPVQLVGSPRAESDGLAATPMYHAAALDAYAQCWESREACPAEWLVVEREYYDVVVEQAERARLAARGMDRGSGVEAWILMQESMDLIAACEVFTAACERRRLCLAR